MLEFSKNLVEINVTVNQDLMKTRDKLSDETRILVKSGEAKSFVRDRKC